MGSARSSPTSIRCRPRTRSRPRACGWPASPTTTSADSGPGSPAPGIDPARVDNEVDECPSGDHPHNQETNRTRHLNRHGDEGCRRPCELELGLELGESASLVRPGRIALHDALEAQSTDCGDQVEGTGQHHRTERAAKHGCAETGGCGDAERTDQHRLLAHPVADARRNRVADHCDEGRNADDGTEPDRALIL